MIKEINDGLRTAQFIETDIGKTTGAIDLGFDVTNEHALGTIDMISKHKERWGEVFGFARGFAGVSGFGSKLVPEIGITGGVGVRW